MDQLLTQNQDRSCVPGIREIGRVSPEYAGIRPEYQWRSYRGLGKEFEGGHEVVDHGALEYARGDAYTNTAESFFALLKRGVYGTFHSVSKKHLHRYMAEFGFRWNTRKMNDGARVTRAIRSGEGKRLMYREPKVA